MVDKKIEENKENKKDSKEYLKSLKSDVEKTNPENNGLDLTIQQLKDLKSGIEKSSLEKKLLQDAKERLNSLKLGIDKKSNKVEGKIDSSSVSNKEIDSPSDNNTDNNTYNNADFIGKQASIFNNRKKSNLSRPTEAIWDAYMDVAKQISEWLNDKNIIARWLAKLMNFILKSEK